MVTQQAAFDWGASPAQGREMVPVFALMRPEPPLPAVTPPIPRPSTRASDAMLVVRSQEFLAMLRATGERIEDYVPDARVLLKKDGRLFTRRIFRAKSRRWVRVQETMIHCVPDPTVGRKRKA